MRKMVVARYVWIGWAIVAISSRNARLILIFDIEGIVQFQVSALDVLGIVVV